MNLQARKSAFTLIELMIVVAIIGLLAAIGIPAMVSYLRRSKAAEAFDNLRTLSYGAATYYAGELWGDRAVEINPSSALAVSHCTVPAATTANTPGLQKTVIDWTAEDPAFQTIGFTTRDPVYFQYGIADSDGACGHLPLEPLYSFRAFGDLDGDGFTSLYELSAGASQYNELMRSPGVYIDEPFE